MRINSEWNIVYHMNLSHIQEEFTKINTTVETLTDICVRLQNNYNVKDIDDTLSLPSRHLSRKCGSTLDQIKLMMEDIEEFNSEWFYNNDKSRSKRTIFETIGVTLRNLFGTLAQEVAEGYLRKFINMIQTGLQRQVPPNSQTTFIKSTGGQISQNSKEEEKLREKTLDQFDTVSKLISTLHKDYENIWINMELQFQVENLLMQVSLSINNFKEKQRKMSEALSVMSKSSTGVQMVLTPKVLATELDYVQSQLRAKNLQLPLDLNKNNIAHFYHIATTKSRVMNDQLIISMTIPLLTAQPFDLLHLISSPHRLPNGLYNFIIPPYEYIAVDPFREVYIPLNNMELENCHDVREVSDQNNIICIQNSPIRQISQSRDNCGITFLSKNTDYHSCETRISNITHQMWITMREPNTFMTVFPANQLIYVKCSNSPAKEIILNGTGIFRLNQDCQAKTDDILIQAHRPSKNSKHSRVIPPLSPQWKFHSTIDAIQKLSPQLIPATTAPNMIFYGEMSKLRSISAEVQTLTDEFKDKSAPIPTIVIPKENFKFRNFFIIIISSTMINLTIILICFKNKKSTFYVPNHNFAVNETPV